MLSKLKKPDSDGFTIIEVMIVLAIAALILVIVFLAVPALQRSSRNTSRRTDASNSLSALSNYISNNGGQLPSSNCQKAGTGAGECSFLQDVKFGYYDPTTTNVGYYTDTTQYAGSTPSPEQMWLVGDAQCGNGEAGAPTAGKSTRQYVVYYGIEGSTSTQCVEG